MPAIPFPTALEKLARMVFEQTKPVKPPLDPFSLAYLHSYENPDRTREYRLCIGETIIHPNRHNRYFVSVGGTIFHVNQRLNLYRMKHGLNLSGSTKIMDIRFDIIALLLADAHGNPQWVWYDTKLPIE